MKLIWLPIYLMSTGDLIRGRNGWNVKLANYFYPALRLRMSGAITPVLLGWATKK
jgi:hypothetical protein